jgi:hypothetical protein
MDSQNSNVPNRETQSEDVIPDNAVRSGRPVGTKVSRWRGAIIVLGFGAAVAAVATTYCMRRVPLREMKRPGPVSAANTRHLGA